MTQVNREETILALDWIRAGIADLKIPGEAAVREGSAISTGAEEFEAPESDDNEESKLAAGGAVREEEDDEKAQEVA
jgi:hypothetical protein